GWIFACNEAWRDHFVDLLGYRDDEVLKIGSQFPGFKATWAEAPHRQFGNYVMAAKDVHLWSYLDDKPKRDLAPGELPLNDPANPTWGSRETVKKGSTGFILGQIAVRCRCNPIVLVGCDCGLLCGFESSSTIIDDSGFTRGHIRDRYEKFAREFEALSRYASRKGIRVSKLGAFGAVNIPIMRVEEILQLERFRDGKN
ncbi:MAG: hypothetical protein ACYTFQ_23720, partial [Planctomycetota bacterium]